MAARQAPKIMMMAPRTLTKPLRGGGYPVTRRLLFSWAPRYCSCQYGVGERYMLTAILLTKHRICHELWRLPRILFQQLDAERQSRNYRYHWHDFERRHVPVHAFPLRAFHKKMGM